MMAVRGGKCIGGLILALHSEKGGRLVLLSALSDEIRSGVEYHLVYETILYLKKAGLEFFDLDGLPPKHSRLSGIREFKLKFEMKRGYRYIIIELFTHFSCIY